MTQPSLFGPQGGGAATANIDGGSRGNPGPAGYGVRIEREDGDVVELKQFIPNATNNVAEYNGLLAALAWAAQHGVQTLHVKSDSELLVKQMRGEYRVKNPGLQPLYEEARSLARRIRARHVRARAPRVQQGRRSSGQRGYGRGRADVAVGAGFSRLGRISPAILPAFSFSLRNDVSRSSCMAVHSPET